MYGIHFITLNSKNQERFTFTKQGNLPFIFVIRRYFYGENFLFIPSKYKICPIPDGILENSRSLIKIFRINMRISMTFTQKIVQFF